MFGMRHERIGSLDGNPSGEARSEIECGSPRLSRAQWLRKAAAGLAGVVGGTLAAGIGGNRVVKAAMTNDPLLLGNSGNTANPNRAEDATEVQYNGAGPPLGVVFLAQADNKWMPAQSGFPAALAGWTSTNPDIPTGVYGYSEHATGMGIVGSAVNNVGGSFFGRNRAPLNLHRKT